MKKKLLLFLIVIGFSFSINICAKAAVVCNYGKYIIEFYPEKYHQGDYSKWYDMFDEKGNKLLRKEQIEKIQPKEPSDCPKQIRIDNTTYELTSSSYGNKVSCGNITDIPKKIPKLTSMAINIVHVAVPVILVIMGSLDLFKGITAQKEDEIKKGQQIFIKRLILAALIFFVVVIVKLLISVVANSSTDNISNCIDCFISNDCD